MQPAVVQYALWLRFRQRSWILGWATRLINSQVTLERNLSLRLLDSWGDIIRRRLRADTLISCRRARLLFYSVYDVVEVTSQGRRVHAVGKGRALALWRVLQIVHGVTLRQAIADITSLWR